MPLNVERIATLIGEARKGLGELLRYRDQPDEVLLSSSEKLGNIKYQFIVTIEACVDLCTHIAAKTYGKTPESYGQCFLLLSQERVIKNDLAEKLKIFAGFRNILVHRYWEVNDKIVVSKLKNELGAVEDFLATVSSFVEQQAK